MSLLCHTCTAAVQLSCCAVPPQGVGERLDLRELGFEGKVGPAGARVVAHMLDELAFLQVGATRGERSQGETILVF